MSENFFNPSGGGDPASFQNGLWFLGDLSIWLTLIVWIFLLVAVIRIAKRLWRAGQTLWLILFIVAVSAVMSYYVWLSINAHSSYAEGLKLKQELVYLQYAKRIVVLLSLLSAVWIAFDWFKRGRN